MRAACTKMVKVGEALPGSFSLAARDERWKREKKKRKRLRESEREGRGERVGAGRFQFAVQRENTRRIKRDTRVETGDRKSVV